jgi:hypothetical protein
LLLSLLLEYNGDNKQPNYWSLFYDLQIDTSTLHTIQRQARILVELSKSLETWTASAYDGVLRMVNTETLLALREYWLKYANHADRDHSLALRFKNQRDDIYGLTSVTFATQGLQSLARSFGPLVIHATRIIEYYTNYFWETGLVDNLSKDRLEDRQCNPMAVYSATGNDRYAIHYRTNSLDGFHLGSVLTLLAPENTHFFRPQKELKDNVPLHAQSQFKAWCAAFQKVARPSKSNTTRNGRLRIRFVVGDAVNFCTGLNHLRMGHQPDALNIYSRPWSTEALRFDGKEYLPESSNKAPLSFNIIDTSNLADDVGFINLLTATVPLLEQSSASVMYTETMKSYPPREDSPNLLSELFCADVVSMCALFGIVPAPYVTGFSTRSKDQAFVDDTTPVHNRINWKVATGIDPKVSTAQIKLACDVHALAKLLFDVYLAMFANESKSHREKLLQSRHPNGRIRAPQPHYSKASFAALLAFIKPRVDVLWIGLITIIVQHLMEDKTLVPGVNSLEDLILQFHLFGVMPDLDYGDEADTTSTSEPRCVADQTHKEPSPKNYIVGGLVITVPRRKLRVLYKAIVEKNQRVNMVYEIHFIRKSSGKQPVLSSIQPIFGKLSPLDGGRACTIERDAAGWHGSADLHLCTYVPASFLTHPKDVEVSVRIQSEICCLMLFGGTLGDDLEVFKARLLSNEYVHLVDSLPGLAAPKSIRVVDNLRKQLAVSNDDVKVTYPLLTPGEQTFTTRITIKSKPLPEDEEPVKLKQVSPCRIAVECGEYKYICSFPFPVSENIKTQIDRKAGWIEVIAGLLLPQIHNASPLNFATLVQDKRYGTCTWGMPYINFRQLPQLAFVEYPAARDSWLKPHLDGMYSDYECLQTIPKRFDTVLEFKKSIYSILDFIAGFDIWKPCIFTLGTPEREDKQKDEDEAEGKAERLLFIVTGLYLDGNTNSIIADANVLLVTHDVFYDPRFIPILACVGDNKYFELPEKLFQMWMHALPAMAEVCRDWEHTDECEFKQGKPLDLTQSPFCCCAQEKPGKDVCKIWSYADKFVTRVAISPMFAAPYLEDAKGGPLAHKRRKVLHRSVPKQSGGKLDEKSEEGSVGDEGKFKCKDCGKGGAKACGGCEEVYYCSKTCQKRDWKKHKGACQRVQEARKLLTSKR